MNEATIEQRAEMSLSPYRFTHVKGVVETADRLAKIHGADPEKARIAGWLHDIAREWSKEKLIQTAKDYGVDNVFFEVTELLHGHIAAVIGQQEFGISDEDLLNAVRFHTSARPGMSILEKVVFLADATEPGRVYPQVESLREITKIDLDEAMAISLDNSLTYLIQKRQPIFPLTVVARNEFWQSIRGR